MSVIRGVKWNSVMRLNTRTGRKKWNLINKHLVELMEEAHLEACGLRGSQTPAAFISCILKDSHIFIQQAFLITNQDIDLVRGRAADEEAQNREFRDALELQQHVQSTV